MMLATALRTANPFAASSSCPSIRSPISGPPPGLRDFAPGIRAADTDETGGLWQVLVRGGNDLAVTDLAGNTTGKPDGDPNGALTGVQVLSVAPGVAQAILPLPGGGDHYEVRFTTADSPLAVEARAGPAGSPERLYRFRDLRLPVGKAARLLITPIRCAAAQRRRRRRWQL
jgi:hypothetical protein